jgi:hypothetical protein
VATADTADSDAVVLVNPIIAAQQAAAATAATVAPVDVPVVSEPMPADAGAAAPAGRQ